MSNFPRHSTPTEPQGLLEDTAVLELRRSPCELTEPDTRIDGAVYSCMAVECGRETEYFLARMYALKERL